MSASENDLHVFDLAADDALRRALSGSGITLDGEALGLLDPSRWVEPLPRKTMPSPDLDALRAHQWQRYGQGVRHAPSAARVLAWWHQRLRRLAEVAGEKTLLCLLTHSQPAQAGASMVFDPATRPRDACSHPYPISADAFVTLAASVGLFCAEPPLFTCDRDGVRDGALYGLSGRDYSVRLARATDIEALVRLEKSCWIAPLRTPKRALLARLERYSEGQFVLERGGEVKGVIYSQRLRDESELGRRTMNDVHKLHDPDGDVVQLLAVNIDPDAQHLACGDQLLEFMLQRSSLQRGVRKIVAVTLCRDFKAGQGLAFREYVTGPGREHDRVLHFHHAHGAEMAAILPGYRPRDVANEGNGVLVVYDPTRRRQDTLARARDDAANIAPEGSPAVDPGDVLGFVMETVAVLVDSPQAVGPERPLMESGLDSAGLLTLRAKLETRFGRRLKSSFFFSHNTPRKVVGFYCADTQEADRSSVPGQAASGPASISGAGAQGAPAVTADAGDVAIVGLACRLPNGIHDLDALWDALDGRRDVISTYPASRGEWPRGGAIERGGFLVDGECFDASFFRMSPSEAELTDPQQRLLLEVSWACFEDACIAPGAVRGTDTGVFVGASNNDYAHLLQEAGSEVEAHTAVGNSLAVLANRLSYFYDFNGPSLLIDTACSASLVALHTAVQSLRARECGLALVGGVNFICHPRVSLSYRKAGMLSPDGRCKVFDDSANGYVRSEGVVALLLKPLGAAIAERNRIHAVIRGSAVNHGGQAAGLTVPNPQRQAALLTSAWRAARVSPQDITCLEAHGTGTSLGDPIEIEGMQSAFAATPPVSSAARCGVGSIKSNIGHLESAAGLAGVLKVVASMAHRRLPASLHVTSLNSRMSLEGSPLYVQVEAQDWDAPGARIAGVSSFGSGGANAHVVLQEHVAAGSEDLGTPSGDAFPDGQLFVLSAIDEDALRRNARAVVAWLRRRPASARFVDALHTWQCGRSALAYRLAAHVRDFDELARQLEHWLEGGDHGVVCARIDARFAPANGFAGGEARGAAADWSAALAQRDWPTLARLWLQGSEGAWSDLYAGLPGRPRFVSLPGQSFERTRYWVSAPAGGTRAEDEVPAETRCLTPTWSPHDPLVPVDDHAPVDIETHVLLWTRRAFDAAALGLALPGCRLRLLEAVGDDVASRYEALAARCFEHARALLRETDAGKVRIQLVADGDEDWVFGLRGLLKSASLEDPRLDWQIVSLRDETPVDALQALLRTHQRAFESEAAIRYTDAGRFVRRWVSAREDVGSHAADGLRAGGGYLITGGLGGLGRLFARHILATVPDARVVVTGRSAPDGRIEADLRSWPTAARPEYRQLSLDRREDVEALVARLSDEGIVLRGILHCAGLVADNFLVNKTEGEFARVLAPKLFGTLHLDEATRDLDLDFFVLFSSITAETGNAGQADYACANGFMDRYAAYRSALASKGLRRGRSLAIDWPYWREGGMRIEESALALLRVTHGMAPMPADVGLECFHAALRLGTEQCLVLHGDLDRLQAQLAPPSVAQAAAADVSPQAIVARDEGELPSAVTAALAALVSEPLKLPAGKLDAAAELARYGIDSIFVNKINLALSRHFKALSKTLFFQYRTVAEVAQYLVRHHADECRGWVDGLARSAGAAAPTLASPRAGAHEPHPTRRAAGARPSDGASEAPIAIIGMSGVFPQADDLDAYWRNLAAGRDCVTEIPPVRWDLDSFYEPDVQRALAQGRSYCKHGAFVDGFARFDPMFFGIPPREAVSIDPHERLFLQEAWRALEDAGYSSGELRRRHRRNVGVFVGVTKTEFELNGAQDPAAAGRWYPRTSFSSIANRLSFFLDLSGPSVPVDTMCSSSLVAIHQACEQIRFGACEAAFAGAVNLYLHPSAYYYLSSLRVLAPDGRCRSFGQGGSGFVPGEGAAVVLLKSLERAIADGDHVHGVILSSHVNHGGRTNGFMVPNPGAQGELVRAALDKARVSARHVSYIEAHGTGTALGDPIEIDGLQQAFGSDTDERQFCAIGSAKSNIGHLEAAAGIAGLLKVLLQMRHRQLAPTLHAEQTNPNIRFESTPFVLNRELRPWTAPVVDGRTLPRIAGVSSFGAGGVNAHVVLREYEPAQADGEVPAATSSAGAMPIPLSALRREQLVERARQLHRFLDAEGRHCSLRDVAYTLQIGRDALARRAVFVVDSVDRLRDALDALVQGRTDTATYVGGGDAHGDERGEGHGHPDSADHAAPQGSVDVHRLAQLWAEGAPVDWRRLHPGPTPRLLSLPTYPFAAETYWQGRLAPAADTQARQDSPASGTLAPQAPSTHAHSVLFAVPAWRALDDVAATRRPLSGRPAFQRHVVLLCDVGVEAAALASDFDRIAPGGGDRLCVALPASGHGAAERYQDIARRCFERLRELASDASTGQVLVQCVISDSGESQTLRGLSALLRTLAMEQSRFLGQVVGVEAGVGARTLATRLHALASRPGASLVRWQGERAEVLDWERLEPRTPAGSVYKDNGVYVITGGLGALGRVFAADIVARCPRATVVLTGRSRRTHAVTRQLEALGGAPARVVHRQLDLQDAAAVSALFGDLRTRYGAIRGVIHCAGQIADSLLVKKSSQDFDATLQPKVAGAWQLDLATRELDLDFFVVFSSIASAMGSIGQADYAAANGFMDHFIHHRRELVARGERQGASVSIHWPYWRDGGMRIDAATLAVLEQSIGMRPMATEVGVDAFHMAVAMDLPRMLVAQGDPERFLARLRGEAAPSATPPAPASHGAWSLDEIQKTLRDMLAELLHARPEDVALRRPLVELGVESVLGTEFVAAINRRFATALSSVGIYDHPTLTALAQYVEQAQPKSLTPAVAPPAPVVRVSAPEPRHVAAEVSRRSWAMPDSHEKIAVIGMSGRYPQAQDLDEYWRNLAAGRNAIVEIPDSRWETAAYYDPDPDAEGKMYCKWMGVLDNADAFDPRFFRITPQEALYMDPEQRLFLQESYRALEDAGYVGDVADGLNCGVYLGMESSEYGWHSADSPRVSETITGNHAAIAASRLAYFLNLKGPALAVDTACSSSLVATHLACQALRGGEVDLALVGGVRLWLSPVTHIGMSKARMLSPTGRCRTFDDAADGIVMGEGVGAVVLKRLAAAERDGDHIHGVILASGINQDGRTNGITAPSVRSQIALERRIYREHDIDPESISYIEAHGTGTKLGDPIELQALSTVFKERTARERFCALGSVKTNIGHTAAASGVASLHKVLLCLKHGALVPTLNVEKENRHFDFEHSPFYINREYQPWQPAAGGKRRACVSSFGFSGTNAHLVLEEYVPPAREAGATACGGGLPILLSARNAAQLEQKARDLLSFVEHDRTCNGGDDAAVSDFLHALAQTLQLGRAAMEERAAFVAASLDDLKAGLRALGGQARDTVGVQRTRRAGSNGGTDVWSTDEDPHGILGLWNTDEDLRATATKWLRERRLPKVLGLWVKGVNFDWRELYGGERVARISLPTYPFAQERFWVDRRAQASPSGAAPRAEHLHPLVHSNVSDLGRQAYRTTLSPRAFYLDDHRVNGARVLPGVAHLEMARAAIALALPAQDTRAIAFLDHAWVQPVVVDREVELTIVLHDDGEDADAGRRIDYEILTEAETGETLHSRGCVHCHADAPELEVVDLAALERAIGGAGHDPATQGRDALYRRFEALGLRYGPAMQGIVDLRTDGKEVLAHLRLPEGEPVGSRDYVLHPSLMDAAMQCTICLLAGFDSASASAAMPFSLEELHVHGGTEREMRVWVRPSAEPGSGASPRLDVDLMDLGGVPRVSLRGLVARPIRSASAAVAPSAPVAHARLASRPSETTRPRSASLAKSEEGPRPDERKAPAQPTLRALLPVWNHVRFGDTVTPAEGERGLLLGGGETLFEWLRPALADLRHVPIDPDASIEAIRTALAALSFDHLFWFAPDVDETASIVSGQNGGVLSLFRVIKALTQLEHHERELKLTVVTFRTQHVFDGEPILPHHAGVHGLVGSVAKELPLWRIRLLDIESTETLAAHEILALPWDEKGRGLAHRGDEWFRQEFAEVVGLPQAGPTFRRNGTYVVIGGAGGLGEVWTRHMVARHDANVVWIGRRPLDDRIEAKLDAIAAIGRRPHYIAADAADAAALAAAIERVHSVFPKINGVVHSALVLQDQSVRGMDEAVFRQSLAAKVDVSVNLEQVFRGHNLDFMLFFSSLSSFYRGAGQSNYCAGCTFKDSFAHALRASQPYPVKIVNWGYWGSVGVVKDEFYRKRMESLGFGSIEPEPAMEALERFVASEISQLVLVDVIADAALDDLTVSEEIRHYPDLGSVSEPVGDLQVAS